jgi:ribosome recycling factor
MAYNFSVLKTHISELQEWLKNEFGTIRTGRATPSILDKVAVEAYGNMSPINQVASIAIEGARSLRIVPWDQSQVKAIEKAILVSNLGLSVAVDDKGLRVNFPDLTTETRMQFVKLSKQKLEEARKTLRRHREDCWEDIQAKEKEGGMGEDEKFRLKNEMQKMIDDTNGALEALAVAKEKEIMN